MSKFWIAQLCNSSAIFCYGIFDIHKSDKRTTLSMAYHQKGHSRYLNLWCMLGLGHHAVPLGVLRRVQVEAPNKLDFSERLLPARYVNQQMTEYFLQVVFHRIFALAHLRFIMLFIV